MAWTDGQFNSYEEDSWQTRTTNPNPFIWYFLQGQKVAKFCEKFSITVRNTKLLVLWDGAQIERRRADPDGGWFTEPGKSCIVPRHCGKLLRGFHRMAAEIEMTSISWYSLLLKGPEISIRIMNTAIPRRVLMQPCLRDMTLWKWHWAMIW